LGIVDALLRPVRDLLGNTRSPRKEFLLFVDGENSPPPPGLMMDKITSHAGSELHLALAYGKWWPDSDYTLDYREAGIECVQADHGSNNADIMLSLRALKEVKERVERGQGGVAYIAFSHDKGFSHVLQEIRKCRGWKSVLVTSIEQLPKILVNSCSEVLTVTRPSARKEENEVEIRPSKAKTAQKPVQDISIEESFEKFITAIIGEDKIPPSTLGTRIIEHQKRNEWDEIGKKGLFKRFGLSTKLSYKDALEKYLPMSVEIFETPGSPPKYEISLKESEESSPAIVTDKEGEPEVTEPGTLEFEEFMTEIIGQEWIDSHALSSRIIEYQEQNGWEVTGKNELLRRFGIPPKMSYKAAIERNPDTLIGVSGAHPVYVFSLKKSPDEGAQILLQLIRGGASNGAILGSRMVDFQKSEGWPETGRSAFNERFGVPENQHYVKTIQQLLPDKVEASQDPALGNVYRFDLI